MHELSLCQALCLELEQQAMRHGVQKISRIRLQLGCLSCVSAESLRLCFEAINKPVLYQDAELDIERLPSHATCTACGCHYTVNDWLQLCPDCGASSRQLELSETILLKEIEIKT